MKRRRAIKARRERDSTPQWVVFVVIAFLTLMVCVAINIRAFSELFAQRSTHSELSAEIEKLKIENSNLKKEVRHLKTDAEAIEREARKIGMTRPETKSSTIGEAN